MYFLNEKHVYHCSLVPKLFLAVVNLSSDQFDQKFMRTLDGVCIATFS